MHLPDTAPRPLEPKPKIDLDLVLSDAEGNEDLAVFLGEDLASWRRALNDLASECRSDIAALNAERKSLRQGQSFARRREIETERGDLVGRLNLLEIRLRYVKSLETPLPNVLESGDALAQVRYHLTTAIELLAKVERAFDESVTSRSES